MTITYRQTKGSALLYGEVDENFRDLLEDTTLQRVLTNGNVSNLTMTVEGLTTNTANITSVTVSGFSTNTLTIPLPTTPANATAAGVQGQITWDLDYIYVCVANNTWKRSALTTWV
jgi:hypothetical protein